MSVDLNHKDITPNESQLTLLTIASDCVDEDVKEPPLTQQESPLEAPVTSKSSPKRIPAREKVPRRSHVQAICIVLTVAMLVIMVGVTVPALFYYLLVGEGSKLFRGRATSSRSSQCLPQVYKGVACQNSLQSYQDRNGSLSAQILVASVLDQEASESQAVWLLSNISNMQPNVTSECIELLTDFSCLFLFGLCTDNETLLLPSPEQCMIIEDTCIQGLKSYAATLGVSINCSVIENQSPAINGSSVLDRNNMTVCREDFYLGEDGQCRADCSKFEYWPHHIEVIFNAIFIVAIVTGTSGGVVVIVVSCIRHKKLLTYPSVFIVYQTITMLLYEFAVLVGRFDQAALFCSSVDLEESLQNPTAFCSFSGVVFMYIQLQLWIWLFFHVFSLFWGLKFPFHYRSYQTSGRIKYIHAAMIVAGILIPIVPAFLPFAVNGYGYSIRVPPVFCVPIDISLFVYPLALPIGILSSSSMVFFVYIFWIITKLRQKKSGKTSTITTPEAKILFLTSSFLFGGAGAIVGGAIFLYRFNATTETLIAYLNCESGGTNANMTCIRSSFEDAYYPYQGIFDLGNIGSVLYPAFNLIYVAEVQKVKNCLHSKSK